jgi:hypothetical protein
LKKEKKEKGRRLKMPKYKSIRLNAAIMANSVLPTPLR